MRHDAFSSRTSRVHTHARVLRNETPSPTLIAQTRTFSGPPGKKLTLLLSWLRLNHEKEPSSPTADPHASVG